MAKPPGPVVSWLGGGVIRAADARLLGNITAGIREQAPEAQILRLEAPPVLGAALIGLDELGLLAAARVKLRAALTHRRLAAR